MIYSFSFYFFIFLKLFCFLYGELQPFWSALVRVGHFVLLSDEVKQSVQALFEEFFIHILGASGEEELYFDAVSFLQPFRSGLGLELEVMIAGGDLYLDRLGFGSFRSRLGLFLLLIRFVLELAVVHYLRYGRICIRGYFNQVEAFALGRFKCFFKAQKAEIFIVRTYDAEFFGPYLIVYSFAQIGCMSLMDKLDNSLFALQSQPNGGKELLDAFKSVGFANNA